MTPHLTDLVLQRMAEGDAALADASVQDHLRGCERCARIEGYFRAMLDALRSAHAQDECPPSTDALPQILRALQAADPASAAGDANLPIE
jgi:hypothetical protein